MKTINLTLNGPFGWFEPENKSILGKYQTGQYGIYLWTVQMSDGLLVNYVGETKKTFRERHISHLRNFLNGSYLPWTYEADNFRKGIKNKLWKGDIQAGTIEFRRRKYDYFPKIIAFLNSVQIYIVPTQIDDLSRKRIESAITNNLMKQPSPVGDFIDPDHRYKVGPSKNSREVSIRIHAPLMVIGIDDNLTAWIPD